MRCDLYFCIANHTSYNYRNMEKILYSFTWTEGEPHYSDLQSKLGIAEKAIDKTFGIVEIDPMDNLYCILVDVNALPEKIKERVLKGGQAFSNPKISPFGLQEE